MRDQGALVVDVTEETDTKEIPPCMILEIRRCFSVRYYRSCNYREENEDLSIRIRLSMWWTSVRNCILSRYSVVRRKTGIVKDDTKLSFLGFGTMNGKDGKPFQDKRRRCYASGESDR